MNDLTDVLSGELDGEEQDPQKQYSPDNPFAPQKPAASKGYSPDNPFAPKASAEEPTAPARPTRVTHAPPSGRPARGTTRTPERPLRKTKDPIQNYDPRTFDNVLTRAFDSPEALHEQAISDREAAESSSIPATPTLRKPSLQAPEPAGPFAAENAKAFQQYPTPTTRPDATTTPQTAQNNPNPSHLPEPVASILKYGVDPMLENPLTTAIMGASGPIGGALAADQILSHELQYGASKLPGGSGHLFEGLPPVSGKQAAVEGALLGLPIAGAHVLRGRGAPVGPEMPLEGANLAEHPERLLADGRKPASATGRVVGLEPEPTAPDFTVETNSVPDALDQLTKKYSKDNPFAPAAEPKQVDATEPQPVAARDVARGTTEPEPTPEAAAPQDEPTPSAPKVDRAAELEQTIKEARKVYASARKQVATTPEAQQRQTVLVQNLESVINRAKKEYDQVTASDRGMVVDHDGEVRFPSAYSDGGSPREIPRVATSALIDDLVDLTDRLQTSAGRSANVLRPDDGFYSSNDGRAAFVASVGPLGRKGPSQQAAARTNAVDQQARLAAVHAELVKRGLTDDDIAEHFFERSDEKAGKAQNDNAVYKPNEHDVIRDEHGAVLFEPPAAYADPLPGEQVKTPAVWLPDGHVIEGPSHFMALRKAREKGLVNESWHPDFDRNDGWVTSHRPFVSRETAYAIADQADQLGAHGKAEGTNQLYHVDFQPALHEGGAEYGGPRPKLTGEMLSGSESAPKAPPSRADRIILRGEGQPAVRSDDGRIYTRKTPAEHGDLMHYAESTDDAEFENSDADIRGWILDGKFVSIRDLDGETIEGTHYTRVKGLGEPNVGGYDKSQLDAFSELQQHPDSPDAKAADRSDAVTAFGSVAKRIRLEREIEPALRELREKLSAQGIQSPEERSAFVAQHQAPSWLNLAGTDVSTVRNLRNALTVMRHPLSEHMSILFKDANGVVIDHFIYASGAVRVIKFDIVSLVNEVASHAKKLGVTSVVASHNHPSGDPTFSPEDSMWTHAVGDLLHQQGVSLDGHMTIDHDTAVWVTPNGEGGLRPEFVHIPNADSQEWTTAVQRGVTSATAQNVAALARDSVSPEATTVLYRDAQGRILVGEGHSKHVGPEQLLTHIDQQRGNLAVYDAIIAAPVAVARAVRSAVIASRGAGMASGHYVTDVLELASTGANRAPSVLSSVQRGLLGQPDKAARNYFDTANARIATRVDDGAPVAHTGHSPSLRVSDGRGRDSLLAEPTDLFGNEDESPSESNQGSLFSPREGTTESRSLKETERAARSELETLHEKYKVASAFEKIKLARRMSDLERLVNRGKAISESEIQKRRRAEGDADATLLEPTPEYDAKSGQYVDTSSDSPVTHPMPEPTGMGERRATVRPREFARTIQSIFNPESLGPIAKGTAGNIRHETAIRFRAYTQAAEDLRDLQKHVDKQPRQRQVELWDAYERGVSTGDPYVDAANAVFRRVTEQRTTQLVALNKLRAEAAIDNYIGRFWAQKNPKGAVANIIARIKSRKPFEGPKSFTRQRTFDYFVEGLDAGLVPPTYNYVESQLAKIQEMERLIGATHTLAAEQANGRAKPVVRGLQPPVDADGEQWVRVDDTEKDPAFNVYAPKTGMVILPDEAKNAGLEPSDVEVIGPRVIGHWYAPKDAVAVWNNHLSKGMRGNPVYDMLAAPGAAATQMILGVSGFHGTVIATEGMFSDMVMAAEHAMSGNAKEAGASLLNIARTPASSAVSALSPQKSKAARLAFGAKVMAEYRKPGTYPELAKVIDGMIAGGFRGDPTSELWSGERTKAFKKAIEQALHGDTKLRQAWGASKVPLDALYAGLEVAAAPLMSRYVPLMKTAATYRAVAQRLQELPSDISPDDFHKEMWDVVNEMDYRFGQVIYDNHFINRFAKDLAQAMFLAPGWTFGTLALMGRGARDVAVAPKRLYDRARGTGDKTQPILGRSGKYWVAAVVGTMVLNGLITRMLTGSNPGDEDPDGWKDFFAFRDGTYDADGNATRHTIPGYLMHDVYGWSHHPYKTAMNKLSPFFAFAGRVVRNETFYGDMVRNPDDDALTQAKQVGKEAVKELGTPLSVQNYLEGRKRDEGGPAEMARNAIGVGPAKREFVRTAAQNKMADYLSRKGHTSLTPEEVEARDEAASDTKSNVGLRPMQKRFKQLTLDQAFTVFDLGSEWEKGEWRALLEKKQKNALKKERSDMKKGIELKVPH